MIWFWIFLIVYIVTIMVLYGFYKEDNNELESKVQELEKQLANKNSENNYKVIYRDKQVSNPVEKIVYKDRIVEKKIEVPTEKIVEKRVEVPVEKIVYKDRIVEKRIEVPVEKVVYIEKDKSDGAVICLDEIKKEADNILNSAFDNAEKIIDDAKKEAQKLLLEATEKKEEADSLVKELEHQETKNRGRILDLLEVIKIKSNLKEDWDVTYNKDILKKLQKEHDIFCKTELITDWEIKDDTFISVSSLRKLLQFTTLYCDVMIDNLAKGVYKRGLKETMNQVQDIIIHVSCLIPYQLRYEISNGYLERVKRKIELIYEIEEYKARKKEEQRLLKEQQREEAAAQREFERELKKAQKDQAKAQEALLKAQEEAEKEKENTDKFNKLQEQIASLQSALEEAQQRSERVMSMAQQTRQGWVYIISNIGSFGENVYKIGMTRRLDPMERVAELGDASVPFPFDVHAMIFSEDAPALETALHHAFEGNRTNLINGKKEFFNVPLSDIKEKVKELGYDATFEDDAVAPQYRDTLFARRNH